MCWSLPPSKRPFRRSTIFRNGHTIGHANPSCLCCRDRLFVYKLRVDIPAWTPWLAQLTRLDLTYWTMKGQFTAEVVNICWLCRNPVRRQLVPTLHHFCSFRLLQIQLQAPARPPLLACSVLCVTWLLLTPPVCVSTLPLPAPSMSFSPPVLSLPANLSDEGGRVWAVRVRAVSVNRLLDMVILFNFNGTGTHHTQS